MSNLRADTISAANGTDPVTLTKQSAAKAWVYAETDATITDSFNTSSGTDHGIGDYSYATTSAFTSNNYSMVSNTRTTAIDRQSSRNSGRDTESVLAVQTGDTGTNTNTDQVHQLVAHGDLA